MSLQRFLAHLDAPNPAFTCDRNVSFPVMHLRGARPNARTLARLRRATAAEPDFEELWGAHDGLLLYCDLAHPPSRLWSEQERRDDREGLVDDTSFLRFERIADWFTLQPDLSARPSPDTIPFVAPDGIPFATLNMSSNMFVWSPKGVFYFAALSDGMHNQRIAKSLGGFFDWLIDDPVRALMKTASVARFHRMGRQFSPRRFTTEAR